LQVSSQIDSRTILDTKGAEQLLGNGDMLYQSGDMSKPVRIQSAFISEKEVKKVVAYLKDQFKDQLQDTVNLSKNSDKDGGGSKTIFDIAEEAEEEEDRDDKYDEALRTVVQAGKASTSYLQRKLRIGYSRAARIMDELEENGIIPEKDGTKAREVLVSKGALEGADAAEQSQPTNDNEEDQETPEEDENDSETEESEKKHDDTEDEKDVIDDKYFDALDDEDPDTTLP
jgi:S-DNA-T family DNA segregation ATPase FtsK/SpoIIIE